MILARPMQYKLQERKKLGSYITLDEAFSHYCCIILLLLLSLEAYQYEYITFAMRALSLEMCQNLTLFFFW